VSGVERTDGSDRLARATAAWRDLLGDDRVVVGPGTEAPTGHGAMPHLSAPAAAGLVRVRSTDEVSQVVRIAGECGVPLYPVSRGKNWGYGDANPVGAGQVVLDLSGMDRVVEVDPELAYAVVEPGVSQQQLHTHLTELGLDLWMSSTASTPDGSLVGNLVERGFGATPYSDHAAHACGLEVVLADGTVVQTGLDRYAGTAGHVYRWGLGPHLDGLFTQSNLGIVVRAGIWLMPRPERYSAFALTLDDDHQLGEAIDRLRRLRLAGVITGPVFVENAVRTLANRRQYPWEETGGATPLPHDTARALLRQQGEPGTTGAWNALGSLYGTRRGLHAALRDVRDGLRGVGELHFVVPSRLRRTERVLGPLARLPISPARQVVRRVRQARLGLRALEGAPSARGLNVTRWRLRDRRAGACDDPTREGSGLHWLAPVCPATGEHVRRCVDLVERHMTASGFEPLIRIAVNDSRSLFVTTLLTFDRGVPDEVRQAEVCHRTLTEQLIDAGFPPYRAAVTTMDLLDPGGASYWKVVGTLKQALDPGGILAPGRYDPEVASRARRALAVDGRSAG
jgi:4-cresol dehydrogenase (hydroxylating) flavoprotein subunit